MARFVKLVAQISAVLLLSFIIVLPIVNKILNRLIKVHPEN